MVERVQKLIAEARESGYSKEGEEYLHMAHADWTALRDELLAMTDSLAVTAAAPEPPPVPGPYPSHAARFMGIPVYPDRSVSFTYIGSRGGRVATLDPVPTIRVVPSGRNVNIETFQGPRGWVRITTEEIQAADVDDLVLGLCQSGAGREERIRRLADALCKDPVVRETYLKAHGVTP